MKYYLFLSLAITLSACSVTDKKIIVSETNNDFSYLIDGGGLNNNNWVKGGRDSLIAFNDFYYNRLIKDNQIEIVKRFSLYDYQNKIIVDSSKQLNNDVYYTSYKVKINGVSNLEYQFYYIHGADFKDALDMYMGEEKELLPFFLLEGKRYPLEAKGLGGIHNNCVIKSGWIFNLKNKTYLLMNIYPSYMGEWFEGWFNVLFEIKENRCIKHISLPSHKHYSGTVLPFNDFNLDGVLDFLSINTQEKKDTAIVEFYSLNKERFFKDDKYKVLLYKGDDNVDGFFPEYKIDTINSDWFFKLGRNFNQSLKQEQD